MRKSLVIIGGFTAALCWWIGIVGLANSGGGAGIFLTVPVLATIGTLLAARHRGRRAPRHSSELRSHTARSHPLPATRYSLVIIGAFTAVLCWWIGIVGLMNSGGGAALFLAVPVLATLGTLLVARSRHSALGR
jgi:hypothetical protein